MKKVLLLVLTCFVQNLFSQHKEPSIKSDPDAVINKTEVISRVDTQPEFPGGPEALHNDFLKKNYKMPKVEGLKGKVYVTVTIEKDGTLSNIKILRDIGYGTGDEAIRVLKLSPKWIPAKRDNKPVKWEYSFPITIVTDEPYFPISVVPNDDGNQVYNTAGLEVKPEFPGGLDQLYKFIAENYKKPEGYSQLKGKVYVTFIIEKNGSLTDIKILRDIGYGTGAEAIRVLKICPKWIPGKQNNNEVKTLYSLPITIN